LPSLVALDIVLKNTKKNKLKINQAQPQQLKTGHVAAFGRKRFVIFSIQVPDKRYQPTIHLTWNQLRINLAFCVQSFGLKGNKSTNRNVKIKGPSTRLQIRVRFRVRFQVQFAFKPTRDPIASDHYLTPNRGRLLEKGARGSGSARYPSGSRKGGIVNL
jgi:hypothetical protein